LVTEKAKKTDKTLRVKASLTALAIGGNIGDKEQKQMINMKQKRQI